MEYGFLYDSSLMDQEVPYLLPTPTDGSPMVEIPVCWELDDAPHFLFSFFPNYVVGLSSPQKVFEIWKAEFEAAYDDFHFFALTMHPQVIGRPHRMRMLDELITLMKSREGVVFKRCVDIAHDLAASS